jgi:hypothetical protein
MSTSLKKVDKTSLRKHIDDLIAGVQKHEPNGTFTFGSKTYAAPALVQLFQSLGEALDATDDARARWQDALTSERAVHASVLPVIEGFRQWIAVTHAGTPSMLADFGVAPRKARTTLTAEQQAAAVLKNRATRLARKTLGSRQKKAVKGDVVGITVAPVTSVAKAGG